MISVSKSNAANKLTESLLAIYFIILVWILLFKVGVRFSYMDERIINLVPFKNMGKAETISNAIIFIPLGLYAGVLFGQWTWLKKLLFFFAVSFTFEALQIIFKIGAFDITDLITNTSGGIIGLLLFELIAKLSGNRAKAQKIINIIGATGTVIVITFLVLLKLSMLPIKYQ